MSRKQWLPIFLYVLAVVYLCCGMHISTDAYDEGIALFGGWRVAHGDMPYRDFWTIYGPAQFYVYGLIFKLFGSSLLVAHIWEALVRAFIAVAVYLISSRLLTLRWALAAWLLTLLWLFSVGLHGYNLFPAMACLLAVLHLAAGRSLSGGRLIAAAVISAAAFFFRYEYGALCLFAAWICASPAGLRSIVKSGLLFVVCLIPVLGFFIAKVPLKDLHECLIQGPLLVYPHTRHLSLLDIGQYIAASNISGSWEMWLTAVVVLFFPPIISLSGLAVGTVSRQRFGGGLNLITCSLVALGVTFTNIQRYDFPHAFAAYPLAFVVLFALVARTLEMNVPLRSVSQLGCLVVCLPLLAQPIKFNLTRLGRRNPIALTKNQRAVMENVNSRIEPGRPVFVGNRAGGGEDGNNVLMYFLLDRPAATRYHELHPGVADTEDVQERIAGDLDKNRPPIVLLAGSGGGVKAANVNGSAKSRTVLSQYIGAHYKRQTEIGEFEVLERAE